MGDNETAYRDRRMTAPYVMKVGELMVFRLKQWIAISVLAFCGLSAFAAQTLTLAVVPQFSARTVFSNWTPLLKLVGEKAGVEFNLRFYDSIPLFEAGFTAGEPDLAYMNPYHMVMAKNASGYLPLIRDDASRLSGILVVRQDSNITQLSQLQGQTVAFPAPNAFGASLYMRALLAREAKIDIKPIYVKTHPNVYRHVLLGQAAAGGGVNRTLNDERTEVKTQLRVLYKTPEVYSHPLAVHPRVTPELAARIQKVFLDLAKDPANAALFKEILLPNPVMAQYSEYSQLDQLSLEKFVVNAASK